MEYILSDDAKKDLEDIVKYLISKEKKVASSFLKNLKESCKILTNFPEIAPSVAEKIRVSSPYTNDMRFWAMSEFKKYTIFYIKEGSEIVVIRILHNKRNAIAIFSDKATKYL